MRVQGANAPHLPPESLNLMTLTSSVDNGTIFILIRVVALFSQKQKSKLERKTEKPLYIF